MWPNPQETADLVTFTEEIPNGKLHFLCSAAIRLRESWSSNLINTQCSQARSIYKWLSVRPNQIIPHWQLKKNFSPKRPDNFFYPFNVHAKSLIRPYSIFAICSTTKSLYWIKYLLNWIRSLHCPMQVHFSLWNILLVSS